MRLILSFLVLLLWSFSLQANSCYSVRIFSMTSEKNAIAAQKTLQKKFQQDSKFVELQTECDFKFISKKKGKYYAVQLSYLNNKIELQKVLDIVRSTYKDSFVRKENSSLCVKEPKVKEKIKIVTKEIIREVEKIKKVEVIKKVKVESSLFLTLFLVTLLALCIVMYFLYRSQREIKKLNQLLAEKELNSGLDFEEIDFEEIDFDIDEEFLDDLQDLK